MDKPSAALEAMTRADQGRLRSHDGGSYVSLRGCFAAGENATNVPDGRACGSIGRARGMCWESQRQPGGGAIIPPQPRPVLLIFKASGIRRATMCIEQYKEVPMELGYFAM